jgi:hypothetical protein
MYQFGVPIHQLFAQLTRMIGGEGKARRSRYDKEENGKWKMYIPLGMLQFRS